MPFKKITSGQHKGNYSSPSGRVFTPKQVEAYYATDGFTRPVRMADHAGEDHRAKMREPMTSRPRKDERSR